MHYNFVVEQVIEAGVFGWRKLLQVSVGEEDWEWIVWRRLPWSECRHRRRGIFRNKIVILKIRSVNAVCIKKHTAVTERFYRVCKYYICTQK